jgi:hypothetical protein
LVNGQYWEEQSVLSSGKPAIKVGDDALIAPGMGFYTMMILGETEARFAMQIPVVIDTTVAGPTGNMSNNGIYELNSGGYWKVFSESQSSDRRVLLASPNNLDFWIYSGGAAQNPADPVEVFSDGQATAMMGGFSVDDGTQWEYVSDNGQPVPTGKHVLVYNVTFFDDRREDNSAAPYVWWEGLGFGLGPWVSRVQ